MLILEDLDSEMSIPSCRFAAVICKSTCVLVVGDGIMSFVVKNGFLYESLWGLLQCRIKSNNYI